MGERKGRGERVGRGRRLGKMGRSGRGIIGCVWGGGVRKGKRTTGWRIGKVGGEV